MKNSKQVILIGILVLVCCFSQAQEENKKDVKKRAGIRAGYQSSAYYKGGDQIAGTTPLGAFYVGGFRDTRIIPTLWFGAGAEYYQNGARINDDNKRVLHYIGVPLYIKVKLGPVFALTGFEPSFKVAEKQYLLGVKSTPSDKSDWFDAPFFLGAGLKILMISVEARYHWGTIAVYDDSYYAHYFQVGAAVSF